MTAGLVEGEPTDARPSGTWFGVFYREGDEDALAAAFSDLEAAREFCQVDPDAYTIMRLTGIVASYVNHVDTMEDQ